MQTTDLLRHHKACIYALGDMEIYPQDQTHDNEHQRHLPELDMLACLDLDEMEDNLCPSLATYRYSF